MNLPITEVQLRELNTYLKNTSKIISGFLSDYKASRSLPGSKSLREDDMLSAPQNFFSFVFDGYSICVERNRPVEDVYYTVVFRKYYPSDELLRKTGYTVIPARNGFMLDKRFLAPELASVAFLNCVNDCLKIIVPKYIDVGLF